MEDQIYYVWPCGTSIPMESYNETEHAFLGDDFEEVNVHFGEDYYRALAQYLAE